MMERRYRKVSAKDRGRVVEVINATENLSREEKGCAVELLDDYLSEADQDDYLFIAAVPVVDDDGDGADRIMGYVCYGEASLSEGVYDIYWILVAPEARGSGVGRGLISRVEEELIGIGARMMVAETSGTAAYDGARSFYEKACFREAARLKDFFKPGDDKVFYVKDIG